MLRLSSYAPADGTGPATAGLASAIAALPSDGGAILIDGLFVFDGPITVSKRVDFVGETDRSTLRWVAGVQGLRLCGARSRVRGLRLEGGAYGVPLFVQQGLVVTAADCRMEDLLFTGPGPGTGWNIGLVLSGAQCAGARVRNVVIERLVATGGGGTGLLIEATSGHDIDDVVIDGGEAVAGPTVPGAAVFLSAAIAGAGSSDNILRRVRVKSHKGVAFGINSTTYVEFAGPLGWCERNRILDCEAVGCGAAGGGDSGSGLVMVGNSHRNYVDRFVARGCTGAGIVLAGCAPGNGVTPGTAVRGEAPGRNVLTDCDLSYNGEEGLRLSGATYTRVRRASFYENSQKTQASYADLRISRVGAVAHGGDACIEGCSADGGRQSYRWVVGAGVSNTRFRHCDWPPAAIGVMQDAGSGTTAA